MTQCAIEVIEVTKSFNGRQTPALRGVTFAVPVGAVVGLLGPNGAGKSTTIKILSTLTKPSSGRAKVAGYDVVSQAAAVRASIGLTGQYAAVDELLTGRENLVFFGQLRGMTKARARRRAEELLSRFGLTDAADRRVSTYSGGMRRRVDIACGLVVPPKVVFLDEPTTGLDPRSRRDVWKLVSSLTEQGVTVLLTTQYLEEADALSDDIVVVDQGRVIAKGSPTELKRRVGTNFCEVTPVDPGDLDRIARGLVDFDGLQLGAGTLSVAAPDSMATLAEVFRRIDALGVEIADISLRKPSLDEVFFALTGTSTEEQMGVR